MCALTQALLTKSLDSVQDNSLPASLLELKSFYSVPQVRQASRNTKRQVLIVKSQWTKMG